MTTKRPARPRQHVLETLSERHVQKILPPEWICDSSRHDYGLDLSVQLVRGEVVTGREFSIQLKATDQVKASRGDVTHACQVSTANLFLERLEPVMYLVYDALAEVAYYCWVQDYLRSLEGWQGQHTVTIRIPQASVLDEKAVPEIEAYVNAWWDRAMAAPIIQPFNLPADLADFTGREAEIDRVRRLLEQRTTGVISGMGGIGKTALAVHVAQGLASEGHFQDAQLYIDLKGTEQPPLAPEAALGALVSALLGPNPQRTQDLGQLAAMWRAALRGKDAVVLLDNAAGAAQVRPLLPGLPTCAILVTSRRRFVLPGAEPLDLDRMEDHDARALLRRLVPRLRGAEADDVAKACGGLPLALRIAGNYLVLNDDCPVEGYTRRLADERTRLSHLRDPDDPDLDVEAAINLSVAQLDDDLRQAWCLLSLFPAPFDQAGAAAVWAQERTLPAGDLSEETTARLPEGVGEATVLTPLDETETLHRLQVLRNRSLLSWNRDTERYSLHDLLRLAAGREVEGKPEVIERARYCHAAHYCDVAYAANQLYLQRGDDLHRGLALFHREWSHIQAGQAWAARHAGHDDEAARLASDYPVAARYWLLIRFIPLYYISWLEAAVAAARRLGDRQAEAEHLYQMGAAYQGQRDVQRAHDCCEEALAILEDIEHPYAERIRSLLAGLEE